MKTSHRNVVLGACIAVVLSAATVLSLLVGAAQSQTRTQCEPWLHSLLNSPNGIQYILSNIHSIVAERNRNWLARVQAGGSTPAQTPQQVQVPQEQSIQMVRVATKVTEKNDAYHKFSWILTVKNSADVSKSFTAKIEWLDKEGFIIDDDVAYDLTIGPNEERHFTGYTLTDADVADTVSNVRAKIPEHTIVNTFSTRTTVQPVSAIISR